MKKTLIIIGSILIALLMIVTAYSISENKKVEAEKQEKFRQELLYENCVNSAYQSYSSDWNSQCKMLGKGNECSLPLYLSDRVEESYDKSLDRCIDLRK